MTDIQRSAADSIAQWAAENPEVRFVWVFGSRAKNTHRADSDIDIAVELEPVADSEETLTRWIAHADLMKSQLQSRIAPKVDLEWFDPDGSTPNIEAALNDAKMLVYERASELHWL
jgi:predicted nucleotidyltransferase